MLGKLFNLGTGSAAQETQQSEMPQQTRPPQLSLESVQEDIHTRHLLFPDANALFHNHNDQVFPLANALPVSSNATAYDYDADTDLEARHVRVLIMQDAAGAYSSQLLFDSQGPPPSAPATISVTDRPSPGTAGAQDPRRNPVSPRKSSLNQSTRPLVIQPDSTQQQRQGAFDRRSSMHSRTHSSAESELQRARREYNDEINAFASCTFGNSELMAYKGTSTKVHVVPSPADNRPDYAGSMFGDGRGSIGRSSMRSSRLAQSYTSETVSPGYPPASFASSASPQRQPDRRRILITRLFPVTLPNDDPGIHMDSPANAKHSEQASGFPFPSADDQPKKKKIAPKQKRTPMYAVVLVIQLPPTQGQTTPAPLTRSTSRGPGSYTEQDSFPSSMSSFRRSGWANGGTGFANDSLESSVSADLDDRMDAVTQHWDIIMRTLTRLQTTVTSSLTAYLRQEDIRSPDPQAPAPVASFVARTPSLSRRSDDPQLAKPPKTNSKLITLQSQRLQNDETIINEANVARLRIVSGLRAQRVITGQGRWGIWRDEARLMARHAVERENSFFYELLTNFLASHTDWLQALGPMSYRRRFLEQQKSKPDEELFLPARTVIISQDKMLARRLIFMLSAFLPANEQFSTARPHRPSTSASVGPFSQSPPSYVVPILREESLRRKLNRRAGTGTRRTSHSRNMSQSNRTSGVPAPLAHLSMDGHQERRVSDAGSIRSNLPIPGNDLGSRKSSAATTTTVTQETSIPHFSTVQRAEARAAQRPTSSSSIAADDLKRSLRRSDTSGHVSTTSTDSRASGSRWGSVISGLWSNTARRGSSSVTIHESNTSVPTSPIKQQSGSGQQDKLAQMVREVSIMEGYRRVDKPRPSTETTGSGMRGFSDDQAVEDEPERLLFTERTPDPNGAFQSPVKTTINPQDGVIDVDIPFPDYITSFETAVSSPSSSGYLSTPGIGSGLDGFEQLSRMVMDGDLPMNVAGFLQRYHQDFLLQALPPQEGLVEQIKESMRSEPTPSTLQHHGNNNNGNGEVQRDRWVDISSVIIADTAQQTIKQIRYRRLIRANTGTGQLPHAGSASSGGAGGHSGGTLTPSGLLSSETPTDEEFIEEPISAIDDVLISAIERVSAQSVDNSKRTSTTTNSSRSASKVRDRSDSEASQVNPLELFQQSTSSAKEVPRGECRNVVLSALQQIIREVMDERDQGIRRDNRRGRPFNESPLRDAVRQWLDGMDPVE